MKQIFRNIWRVTQREVGRMFIRPLYMFASVGVMVLCVLNAMRCLFAGKG